MNQCKKQRWAKLAAGVALALVVSTGQARAAALPLNAPRGLAVNAKGDLYVANEQANDILVYNPNYVQLTAKTITQGISQPTAVAFDSKNNLYVTNGGSKSVTEYLANGEQYSTGTITTGIDNPWAIAIDPLGVVYVSNNFSTVTVYSLEDPNNVNGRIEVVTFTPTVSVYGIAAHGTSFAWGSANFFYLEVTSLILAGQGPNVYGGGDADEALAMAYDKSGNLYIGNGSGELDLCEHGTFGVSILAQTGFSINGVAVDSARGRIYLSNESANEIAVYSTAGKLIKVIK
jgi:DNA-binding beta-propeller fold protein YncE